MSNQDMTTRPRITVPIVIGFSFAWLALMVLIAITVDLWQPHDYQAMNLRARFMPPSWMEGGSWSHIFGTDNLGRDVFSRLAVSIRISLLVALLGTLIGAVLGTVIGLLVVIRNEHLVNIITSRRI